MSEVPLTTMPALSAAGRTPRVPFRVSLPDGEVLEFQRLLRLLPGKRLAGLATWREQPVFAKLFVASGARRHGERERDGVQALLAKGIPTPALLAALPVGSDGYLVVTEYLEGAFSLEDCPVVLDQEGGALPQAFALLGRMHAAGLVHMDLHFGNFLRVGSELRLIDGDGVRTAPSSEALSANLALLFSQLPPVSEAASEALLRAYGREVDRVQLVRAIAEARERRLHHFLQKTVRNCTQFAVDRSIRRFSVALRDAVPWLQPLLAAPDRAVSTGQMLKDGGTCTVASASLGDRQLVIKRYNLKGWRHALSRAWRPSRAWRSWREAHRLSFYGIDTPRPLAMIEERLGPLRGRAFFVTQHCPGANLLDCLDPGREPAADQQAAIRRLFETLFRERISHGDLKATNLLWQDGRVVVIDLDAMVQHRSERAFKRAWRRDRARLLRNWPADSVLVAWLDSILPVAD